MAKKLKHEEHENLERWLVSYADFITLLFAFFVVMYAISSVNEGKFRVVSESIQAALHPLVSLPSSPAPIKVGESHPTAIRPIVDKPVEIIRRLEVVLAKLAPVDVEIKGKGMTELGGNGFVISIAESMLFESGKADLRPDALRFLEAIAQVLEDAGDGIRAVRVEGHTDNVPIKSLHFPSNWELSAIRATVVARVLTELYNVAPEKVSATGFAQFRPVADNLTPEGRAKNRRVELVVLTKESLDQP